MNVSEPPDPRRARHRPSGRTVGRAVISAELVVLFVLFTLWQGPSSGGPGHGPTPTLAAPDTTTAGTSPKATTISPTSTSTPAWLLDATPTAEPAPVLEEVAVPSSTATPPPVSTPPPPPRRRRAPRRPPRAGPPPARHPSSRRPARTRRQPQSRPWRHRQAPRRSRPSHRRPALRPNRHCRLSRPPPRPRRPSTTEPFAP